MRLSRLPTFLLALSVALSRELYAQESKAFAPQDLRKIIVLGTNFLEIQQELLRGPDTAKSNCRSDLFKYNFGMYKEVSQVESLMFMSWQMTSKQDEGIVNGHLKNIMRGALTTLELCPDRVKRAVVPFCHATEQINQAGDRIKKLCAQGTALLNELLEKVKNH